MHKKIIRLRIAHYLIKIYNPLNKLVRRIKENMILILATAGMACLPIAFSLLLFGYGKEGSFWNIMAGLIFLVAIGLWEEAIRRAKREDTRKEQQMDTLIRELRGLRDDINRRDRS